MLQVQIEQSEDCAVCLESLQGHTPVITTCGHSFGFDCIKKVIEMQHKCPFCRRDLKDETVIVEPANECGDESKDDEMDLTASSSKLEALMSILNATKVKSEKTVIFSQWTKFLDIVEHRLSLEGYKFCRIDGTMPSHKRDAALQAFESDDKTTVMLASLGVCAVGLNLTSANQIILSDSWWAPAIEDQAVDRVHRLGQTKACRVFRLVVESTIEDSVLDIQKEKRKLMRLAFGEKTGKRDAVKHGRMADIQRMLNA
jgi:SWI/SNF-related matrix-associated actin-dependent regulator of chromatin subfamily A3